MVPWCMQISAKVHIRPAVAAYHTCVCKGSLSCQRSAPVSERVCECVYGERVGCAPVYVMSCVSVASLKPDVINLW